MEAFKAPFARRDTPRRRCAVAVDAFFECVGHALLDEGAAEDITSLAWWLQRQMPGECRWLYLAAAHCLQSRKVH